MSAARIAVRFSRGQAIRAMAHSEALRLWEAVLTQSGLRLEQTEGRSARLRFSLAAPLPAGYESDAEFIELHLAKPTAPQAIVDALNAALPDSMRALEATPIEPQAPSLQSRLRWAEYRFEVSPGTRAADVDAAIEAFFALKTLPWEETFDGKTKHFDLRALVDDACVDASAAGVSLWLRLDAAATGTGRPDSVLAGLNVEAARKRRTRLVFSHLPEAIGLWRRAGRFENTGRER